MSPRWPTMVRRCCRRWRGAKPLPPGGAQGWWPHWHASRWPCRPITRQIRQQAGWWGLLGRDVDREAEGRALQSQLGVLALQAREQASSCSSSSCGHGHRRTFSGGRSAGRLGQLAAVRLASLDTAGQAALSQRLDHLRRLATLRRLEAGQWQLLQDQDNVLLQRFARIHDVLLPAWRQAAAAGRPAGAIGGEGRHAARTDR